MQKENKIILSEKELNILSLLAKNSRIKTIDLAKRTNLSETTVLSKIKEFKKNKILLSYNIGLDINKLGYKYFKLHLNFKNYTKKRFEEFLGYCKYQENIWSTINFIGSDDIEMNIYILKMKTNTLIF
jgi:DNA-binding Lrp family transcriptional regulator